MAHLFDAFEVVCLFVSFALYSSLFSFFCVHPLFLSVGMFLARTLEIGMGERVNKNMVLNIGCV